MGTGVEAGGIASPYARRLRQPAYGEYTEQPEVEAQYERTEQAPATDGFVRRAQWPVLCALAGVEIAWLLALMYVIHRFLLSPILG